MEGSEKSILFFAPALSMGGVATAFVSLAAELERNGWTVKVLLPYQTDMDTIAVPKRYVVGYARSKEVQNRKLQRLLNLLNVLTGYCFYFIGIPRIDHDIFVVFQAASFAHWVKYSRKPVIGWLHGVAPAPDGRMAGKMWTKVIGKFYNRFSKLVAITNQVANDWQKRYAIQRRPTVIPNLVDAEAILEKSRMGQSEILSDGEVKNLVFVGRLAPEKGVARLIKIAIRLHNEGHKFVLWIVGDGISMEEMRRDVIAAKAEEYIKMIGRRDNPYPYIRACDLLVLPSYGEGLGLVLWEALLCGTEVLATDCGGTADALEGGKLGLLVENSEKGIYEGLNQWFDNGGGIPSDLGDEAVRQNDVRHRKEINEIFDHCAGV